MPPETPAQALDLLTLCALRRDKTGLDWSLLAREAANAGQVSELAEGRLHENSAAAQGAIAFLGTLSESDWAAARARVADEVTAADGTGARLVTVLDDDYPTNLRLIYNLPPFLFVRGEPITLDDTRAIAVVGTRDASKDGLDKARRMSQLLTKHGVVVISGLAKGIDACAHRACLDNNGRTIAVVGTGITRTYPAENADLQAQILTAGGSVVSQFWPTSGPARWTFPRRNVVMSGLAQGTVVIEASSTSGAKMQARLALEHGKKVFLIKSLVTQQPWAQKYVDQRGAIEVANVDQVIENLAKPDRIEQKTLQRQLTLDLI